MSARLRGAVVGCGMISEIHLRAWSRLPEVEIVALADRDVTAAERRRALAPGAAVYADLEALLRQARPDFVEVLTPPALHVEHCTIARRAGVHVICQKPLADDARAAGALVAAFRDHPRLFVVHENHRYRPWFQEILRRQAEGFFGRIHLVRLEQLDPRAPAEAYKVALPRAVLFEYGIHLVDMMRALLGEPRAVFARAHRLNPAVVGESLAHVTYEYPEATAVIDVGWKPGGAAQGSLLVIGDRGEAYYEGTMTRGDEARFRLVRGREVVLDERRRPTEDYLDSFDRLCAAFVEAMRGRAAAPQTAEDQHRTLLATLAPYASIERRQPISMTEWNP